MNGDGHIDRAEFIAILRDLFVLVGQECLADDELELLYQDADSDGSGFVDKAEFLKMFATVAPVSQPTEEGIQFLAKLGVEQMESLTHAQMTAIMDRYDVNRDGRIDKKEFVNFLRDLFKLVGQDALPDEELGLLYDDVDNDGSGTHRRAYAGLL